MALFHEGMTEPVWIVGVGARTAVGTSARASAAAVRARMNWLVMHPYLLDHTGEPIVTATAHYLPAELSGTLRWAALAGPAAAEALSALPRGGPSIRPPRVLLGLPRERPGLPEGLRDAMKQILQPSTFSDGGRSEIVFVSGDHTAGLVAVQRAFEAIARGEAELALAGGCDSYIETTTLEWLDWRKKLRSSVNRWGFVPGEAAAFCLLASDRIVKRLGLAALGQVLGGGSGCEKEGSVAGNVNVGEGLSEAVQTALQALPDGLNINRLLTDMNGERHRADECGFTMSRLRERLAWVRQPEAPASFWGDVGAASGPLLVTLALLRGKLSSRREVTPLVWTSAEGGDRCAVIVSVPACPPEDDIDGQILRREESREYGHMPQGLTRRI